MNDGFELVECVCDDRGERWATSIHEAAHGVVAASLNMRVRGLYLTADGGGRCLHMAGSPLDVATVAAVGMIPLEELLAMVGASTIAPALGQAESTPEIDHEIQTRAPMRGCVLEYDPSMGADADVVALYAIQGPWESWSDRARRVIERAKCQIRLGGNRELVCRLAERVFLQGFLGGGELPESAR